MNMPDFHSPKTIILSVGGSVVLGVGVWAAAWRSSDGSAPSTLPVELQFASLKAQSTEPGKLFGTMREQFRREDLTDEQRQELRQNVRRLMREGINERMEEYFSAPADQQDAVLDQQIDQMQQMFAQRDRERQGDRSREGRDNQRPRRQATQEQRKTRSESSSPDERVRQMIYFTSLQSRAAERGIQILGRTRGPGGGGNSSRRNRP